MGLEITIHIYELDKVNGVVDGGGFKVNGSDIGWGDNSLDLDWVRGRRWDDDGFFRFKVAY